jgi:hypothetical protein
MNIIKNTLLFPVIAIFVALALLVSYAYAQAFEPAQYTQEHVAGVWYCCGNLNGEQHGAMMNVMAAAMDSAGNIYTAESGRVRVIDHATGRVWNLAGTGIVGFKDGPAGSAQFNFGGMGYDYEGIAVDSIGNVYVADGFWHGRIRKIYQSGGQRYVTTIAGGGSITPSCPGYYSNATSLALSNNAVVAVAVDSSNNVWTTDWSGIYKIAPNGSVNCFALAPLTGPAVAMAADGVGNVYELKRAPNLYYKTTSSGVTMLFAGGGSGVDGAAIGEASFFAHTALAVTSDGSTVYGGNGDEFNLRRIKSGYAMTLHKADSYGAAGWRTDNSLGIGWLLGGPMFVGPDGSVYLTANNPPKQLMLRKIIPV